MCSLSLLFGDVLVAVAVAVCVRSLLNLCLRWFYRAASTRQTKVRKLIVANLIGVCVNGTKTVEKHGGKQLATKRTGLISDLANFFTNFFFVLVNLYLTCERWANACWLLSTNQNTRSSDMIYLHDDNKQNG